MPRAQQGNTKKKSERQGKLLAAMDRKRSLMSEPPEELRTQIFQEIRDLDEKIMPKWRKGELRLLLELASLGKQQLDLEVPNQT